MSLVGEQVRRCESLGVDILCCPEGMLGGLADYVDDPLAIAIATHRIDEVLRPIMSDSVSSIIGFTEIDGHGRLFNSAAVVHRRTVMGVYRKMHPAINRSVYSAGSATPVFTIGEFTFGVVVCRDSTFAEPARAMADGGVVALFIPTNNGLPLLKAYPQINAEARRDAVARATENGVWVIRADVVGRSAELVAFGASEIVAPDGVVVASASEREASLVVADIDMQCSAFPAVQPSKADPSLRSR
jgi:5-aminopentanamidase